MTEHREDKLSGTFDNRAAMRRESWFRGDLLQVRSAENLAVWPSGIRRIRPWGYYPDTPVCGDPQC